MSSLGPKRYDAFLSYNSQDRSAVEELAGRLESEGLELFLERWELRPGCEFQLHLAEALRDSKTCVVFLGPNGLGPWQKQEVQVAVDMRARSDAFHVIPVLLPGTERPRRGDVAHLEFLINASWVEFLRTLDDERAFRSLVWGITGTKPDEPPDRSLDDKVCPYRGLEAFRPDDAKFFFGRESLTGWLISALRREVRSAQGVRFLGVLGPSGSGKSSVVLAGLVPGLRAGTIEGSERWPVAILRPGDDPLKSLTEKVVPLLRKEVRLDPSLTESREQKELLADLRTDGEEAATELDRYIGLKFAKEPEDRRLIIVVDQFEEVFTYRPQDDQARKRFEQARASFFANLLNAAAAPGGRVAVVLTIRSDFLSACAPFPQLSAVLSAHQELVGPMTAAELREAIERPVYLVGSEVEPALTERLLADVEGQSGALPLLQFALKEVWKKRDVRRLTREAYIELGKDKSGQERGIEGVLDQRADEIYRNLSPEDQHLCQRLFLRLVQPGEGTEDTKRRVSYRELLPEDLARAAAVRNLVQTLASRDARLITTEGTDATDGAVEVAHEALIRGWTQLREWVNAERTGLRTHRRLTEAAQEWAEAKPNDKEAFLYAGGRLAIAREWVEIHRDELNPIEVAFLVASKEAVQEELENVRRRSRHWSQFAAGLAFAGVLALALATLAYLQGHKAERQSRIALSRQTAAQALVELPSNPQRSLLLAVQSINMTQKESVFDRTAACSLLHTVLAATGGLPLSGHTQPVVATAFSPSGDWLATGSADGTARLWKPGLPASPPIVVHGHTGAITALAFSADSRWLVTSSQDGTVALWDLASPDAAHRITLRGHSGTVNVVACSPAGRWLATTGDDGTVRLWDLNTVPGVTKPKLLRGPPGSSITPLAFRADGSRLASLAFSADGSRLAAGPFFKNSVLVWNIVADGAAAAPLDLRPKCGILAIALSRDGSHLAVADGCSSYSKLHLWNLAAADPRASPVVLLESNQWILAVAFSPDGHRLAAGGVDFLVHLWDLTASDFASRHARLRGHSARVKSIAFSPDDRWLATAGQDASVRLWDLADPAFPSIVMRGHEGTINAIAIDSAGHRLATASDDRTARLWTIPDASAEPTVLHEPGCAAGVRVCAAVDVVAFSRDGRRLASVGRDKTIRVRRLADPTVFEVVLSGHRSDVNAIAFSPDGRWLAATHLEDSNVSWLWDLTDSAASAVPIVMGGHQNSIMAMTFSPGGRWFATGSWDRTIRVWDLTAGVPSAPRHVLSRHQSAVRAIAFSADDRRLVSTSGCQSSRETRGIVWDMTAADPATSPIILEGHHDVVRDVAVSPPDGRWVATAGWDKTARLWDMTAANPSANPVVLKFADRVFSVAFSSDGHWLAAAAWDGLTQLLDVRNPAVEPALLRGPQDRLFATAFSPDMHWLAAASEDNSIWLWNPNDLTQEPTIVHGHTNHIAFSPDGRWLATGSPNDAATRLWSLDVTELMATACRTAGRNLTEAEWRRFLGGQPYHKTSDGLLGLGSLGRSGSVGSSPAQEQSAP